MRSSCFSLCLARPHERLWEGRFGGSYLTVCDLRFCTVDPHFLESGAAPFLSEALCWHPLYVHPIPSKTIPLQLFLFWGTSLLPVPSSAASFLPLEHTIQELCWADTPGCCCQLATPPSDLFPRDSRQPG